MSDAGIQRLVLAGRIGEAIETTHQLYPGLLDRHPNLLFALKCRQFIEMVNGTDSEVRVGGTNIALRSSPRSHPTSATTSPSMSPMHLLSTSSSRPQAQHIIPPSTLSTASPAQTSKPAAQAHHSSTSSSSASSSSSSSPSSSAMSTPTEPSTTNTTEGANNRTLNQDDVMNRMNSVINGAGDTGREMRDSSDVDMDTCESGEDEQGALSQNGVTNGVTTNGAMAAGDLGDEEEEDQSMGEK